MKLGRPPSLKPQQAEEARAMFRTGTWSRRKLAKHFKTTPATIAAVLERKGTYK